MAHIKAWFSEYRLCAFLCGLSVFDFQFIYVTFRPYNYIKKKKKSLSSISLEFLFVKRCKRCKRCKSQSHKKVPLCPGEQTDLLSHLSSCILHSDVDDQFISPCGGCRQFMREVTVLLVSGP